MLKGQNQSTVVLDRILNRLPSSILEKTYHKRIGEKLRGYIFIKPNSHPELAQAIIDSRHTTKTPTAWVPTSGIIKEAFADTFINLLSDYKQTSSHISKRSLSGHQPQ